MKKATKRLLLAAMLLLATVPATKAGESLGAYLKAGFNMSNYVMGEMPHGMKPGFHFGAGYEYRMAPRWGMAVEMYMSFQGAKFDPKKIDNIDEVMEADEQGVKLDKDIHGQEDIINKNGSETQVQYVTDEGALVYLHTQSGDNVFKLNQDGSFSLDGVKQNEEYDKIGVLHIGNDKLTKGINKNWYGSYLGPDNPLKSGREDGKSKYSYAFPPLNDLDYAAYQHDRAYDTMGAVGVMGALLNTETANADLKLACDALCIVSQNKFNFQSTKVRWASAVCRLFSEIAIAKAILNSPK